MSLLLGPLPPEVQRVVRAFGPRVSIAYHARGVPAFVAVRACCREHEPRPLLERAQFRPEADGLWVWKPVLN